MSTGHSTTSTTQDSTPVRHLPSQLYPAQRPGAGRLLDELQRRAQLTGSPMLQVGHRSLAEAIGMSPGSIPRLMAQLEAQGLICRHPWKNSYLVELLEPEIDQSMIDHSQIDSPDGIPAPQTHNTQKQVHTPCMDHDLESFQKKNPCPAPVFALDQTLLSRLLREPGMNTALAQRIAASPPGSLADFEADLTAAAAESWIGNAFFYVIGCWKNGQRFVKEALHGTSVASSTHTQHARRSRPDARAPRSASGGRSGADSASFPPAARRHAAPSGQSAAAHRAQRSTYYQRRTQPGSA